MGKIVQYDDRRVSLAARRYRLLQSHAILVLFERDHHRKATNLQELYDWAARLDLPKPIDPYAILTRSELEAAIWEILAGSQP